jgi:protein-S-isoprenylcysteine O-methyltransferase Ste14
MNEDKKMILGYIAGGLLVLVLVPSIIYIITSLFDNVYRLEIIHNSVIRWIIIILLLVIGLIYGIWSVAIQNTIGKGGPLEIGKIEISPKTKNLVVSGPYKNTITSIVLVCAIFIFMLTVVVKMEEKRLLKDFGNQYEEYREKVSMFIPWFQRKTFY